MTDATDPPPPGSDEGRLVAGRYRLAEIIGVGGMATVHRAIDTKLDRAVAIKLLRREVIEDADIAMRFRREALAATVLRHPNIVACLETGTDDHQPFLVMELIEGEDLAARLRRAGRLAPSDAARIGLDVARALGVAHVRGIVHRDVKPGNILLARDGRAMVTDFGIARLFADAEGAVPGTTLGSVHYFSPEQAKGETTTAASDVYSLGLVLYESLTGRRAWSGDTTAQLVSARIDAAAPSPRALRPDVPAAIDAIVVRALDPDPGRRYPNGAALATALERVAAYPDPSSPTVATASAILAAGAAAAGAPFPVPTPSGPLAAAPLLPRPAATSPVSPVALRRAPPMIAGPLLVLLVVVAIVGGALAVAALPGRGDAGPVAVASATPRATRTPTPTPRPTPTTRPTPVAVSTEAPPATPVPKPRTGVADVCDPILGFACGLGKGTYEPSRFSPSIRFTLGEGWGAAVYDSDLIALQRDSGTLTFASRIGAVYPSGGSEPAPGTARGLVETFIGTDGVAARKPVDQRVDKRKAIAVDLATTGPDRVPLFATSTQTYFLEPGATTRITVVDGRDGVLLLVVEPSEDSSLEALLKPAQPVIRSIRFR